MLARRLISASIILAIAGFAPGTSPGGETNTVAATFRVGDLDGEVSTESESLAQKIAEHLSAKEAIATSQEMLANGQPFTFDFEDGLQGWTLGGSAVRVQTQLLGGNWALFGDGSSEEGAWISRSFEDLGFPEIVEIRVDQFCLGFGGSGCSFLTEPLRLEVNDTIFIGANVFEPLDRDQNPGVSRLTVAHIERVPFPEPQPVRLKNITIEWGGPPFGVPSVEGSVGLIGNITLVPIPEPSTPLLVLAGLVAARAAGRRGRLRGVSGARAGCVATRRWFWIALAIGLLGAYPGNAELVEVDLRTPGDGLITRDPGTALDWLDPKESVDLSFNQIQAGAGGFIANGWRHAIGSEVCDLFFKLGAAPDPCPGGSVFVGFGDVARHFELLGATFEDFQTFEIRAAYQDDGGQETVGLAAVLIGGPGAGLLFIDNDRLSSDEPDLQGGHLLVRPVPEADATLFLSLAALTLLAVKLHPRSASRDPLPRTAGPRDGLASHRELT